MPALKHFRFWCQSVLPLVYDDSLSYYEVLCKVVNYINKLIDSDKAIINDMNQLQDDLVKVEEIIDNFDVKFAESIISEYIATMVFFGLTDDGFFVAYIPDNWDNIEFGTTGYDCEVELQPEYGHLVLLY